MWQQIYDRQTATFPVESTQMTTSKEETPVTHLSLISAFSSSFLPCQEPNRPFSVQVLCGQHSLVLSGLCCF